MTTPDLSTYAGQAEKQRLQQRDLRLATLLHQMNLTERIERVKRIKAHIAAMPGKSYCYPEDQR
jgi:hypothetical protein